MPPTSALADASRIRGIGWPGSTRDRLEVFVGPTVPNVKFQKHDTFFLDTCLARA